MIQKLILSIMTIMLMVPTYVFAQSDQTHHDLKSNVPRAIPTELKPINESMTTLLNKGYKVTSSNITETGQMFFTLMDQKQTILCVVNTPNPEMGRNTPTSRCRALN